MRFFLSRIGCALTVIVAAIALSFAAAGVVHAAATTPQTMVYNGRLLDGDGNAITTAHSIRFSFWKSADYVSGDVTGTGAINTGAGNYANWYEVQTVTPDSNGNFSVAMGSSTALPSMDSMPVSTLTSLSLQVEVKASAAADTAYEILDPKPLDTAVDRSSVLSVPFALNADRLDRYDTGTSSGSIAVLGSGGLLPVSTIPAGTNRNTFTIDADSSATSSIALKFGETLSKTLTYDVANSRFTFNADVRVEGNLTVTGLINGVNLNALATATLPLKVSSGAGLNVSVGSGGYRLNGDITNYAGASTTLSNNTETYLFFTATGGLVGSNAFPTNISFIPLAKVTTSNGAITSVLDRRVLQSDNRENTVLDAIHPGYPDAAFKADGSDNVGQLLVSFDETTKRNFYLWSSTRSTQQDYDIIARVTLPTQFVRWSATPVTLHYKTSSATTSISKLDVSIYDTAGNAVSTSGGSSLASASWTSAAITYSGTPAWTAGQSFIIKIKVSAKDAAEVSIGDLELRYVTLENE